MSNSNRQFLNDVLIESAKEQKSKERRELRAWDLSDVHFVRFRINHEHGIFGEMLIPILFQYVFGTFDLQWYMIQNLLLVYSVIFMGYFRFQTTLGPSVFWLMASSMPILEYYREQNRETTLRIIHFLVLSLNMEGISRFLPGQFSVSELFIFCSLNAFYTTFGLDGLLEIDKKRFIAGCNVSNIIVFGPWYVLNMTALCFVIIHRFFLKADGQNTVSTKKTLFTVCLIVGFILSFMMVHPFNRFEYVWDFLVESVIKEGGAVLVYMLLVLVMGFMVIQEIADVTPNFMLRKSFHILAFCLFMPGIAYSSMARPRLMVFAFNCVTVFLILVEVLRFSGVLSQNVSKWFKEKSSGRERMADTLIATHIWLLMGCAFPLTASYTLFDGHILPAEWALWSCSGIVFLGIGDSAAAILGTRYGKTKWRALSGKTQEGSSFCVFSTCAAYYVLVQVIDPKANQLFLCFVFAAIPAAVVEGCTL